MKASSDELKVFVSVVESGSFSRAAEQLKMANSAVSRTIKKLESKLGIALLTRTTRQLALTQEGERYFRHVQRFLQEMTTAESESGELYDINWALSSNSGETIKQLCLTGNGIACLSDYMIDSEVAEGTLMEVLADQRLPVEMPFNAVYYSDTGVSQRVRAFIDFLSEWTAEQPWRT
ncbi:LysR family transcriptional regulator [Pantoea sp. WMus005]|uniref:LysR family transcriptional regulator n=1 Tax=Pantoea sp. WMus005 TaxID=2750734 RepID=UPI0015CF96CC|nr:LysR family transcriptional regulator [Pantoea sp. WMus005]NYS30198.1 LysR family transcriptional regulator [Pantoea sp. WMus005]